MTQTDFYHYTYRERLSGILEHGLCPGSEVGMGECLPVILLDRREYKPQTGRKVYLKVQLADDDPAIHPINDAWIEYRGRIPAAQIVAIARPPLDAYELLTVWCDGGDEAVTRAFQYVPPTELIQ